MGYFFSFCFLIFFLIVCFLRFLASWIFGFLASRLLGFSASCWFMQLLVVFGFGLPHPLHSQFLFGRWRFGFGFSLWAFLLLHPFIGFWNWLPASSASPVFSLFESTLLQTSWGGAAASPAPPLLIGFLAEIKNALLFEASLFRASNFARKCCKIRQLGNLCHPCMSVCMHFFEHHRGSHPRQPSTLLLPFKFYRSRWSPLGHLLVRADGT